MDKNRNIAGIIIGIVLIVIGVLAFFGRYIVLPDMDSLWPLFVVLVGAAFFIPLALGDRTHSGLAVPGCILVTIGVILYIMNRTDNWEAWSYCWALIICAVGAGTWINGYRSEKPELRERGMKTMRNGLILFIVFGVIMEFIFSASGESRWGGLILWSVLLTLVGIYLLVSRLLQMRKPEGRQVDLFWPVLMIGLGLAAALSPLGGMAGFSFGRLFNLWPILLIALGIGLIFRNRTPWTGLILGILLVVGIFVIIFAGGKLGLDSGSGWFSNIGPINFGNGRQVLTGSGHQITEQRQVSGVKSVNIKSSVDLVIQQGEVESLSVTGDEAILPALLTDVSLGQMTIRYDPRYDIQTNLRPGLVLTVKDLDELRLGSSSDVTLGPLTTTRFNIIVSSSCNLSIQGIKADEISTHIGSSADITIEGEANSLDLDISSSVNFDAGDLKVQKANVNMTSSADVILWVVDDLTVRLTSSGNIAYYGHPAIHQTITSSGELISRGDK